MQIVLDRILWFSGVYLFEIVLAGAFGAFSNMKPRKKQLYLILALGALSFLTMFRGSEVGNDTAEYIVFFENVQRMTLAKALETSRFESGFVIYVWLLTKISSSPQILFIVTGAGIYCSLGRWLNKWSKAPGLFVCLFVSTLAFDSWLSLVRQTIALAILLFAYDSIVERKPIRFLITTIIATQFHNAAFAFLLAYPVVNWIGEKKENKLMGSFELLAVTVTGCVALMFNKILSIAISIFPVYSYYLNGAYTDGTPRLAVTLKILVYGLMLFIPRLVVGRKGLRKRLEQKERALYRLSVMNLALLFVANFATLMARVSGVFTIYAICDYVEYINTLKLKNNKSILIVLSLVLFGLYGLTITLLRTPKWQTTYPFSFCWQ